MTQDEDKSARSDRALRGALDALCLMVDTAEVGGWPSATLVAAKAEIARIEEALKEAGRG